MKYSIIFSLLVATKTFSWTSASPTMDVPFVKYPNDDSDDNRNAPPESRGGYQHVPFVKYPSEQVNIARRS
ncbi:hypothetical protein C8R43DRAFT_991862 [Mycena crocata]|nr:hypothetical protein C8R43DRAFT_991862 [Mycena crocata]